MRAGPALAALWMLAACGGHWTEDSSSETFRFEIESGEPHIEARVDSGSIEVTGSDSSFVEITVHKYVRSFDSGTTKKLLERIGVEAIQDGPRIRLRAVTEGGRSSRSHLRTDVTLRVPARADLDIRTEDGRLRIEGIKGELVAETEDGRITASDTSGSLTLRTEDGSIVGHRIEGRVDAATEDGRIELDGVFEMLRAVTSDGSIRIECGEGTAPKGNWTLRSGDGSVHLALPASVSIDIEAFTNDGVIENRLPRFEGRESEGRLRGRTGEGGSLVFLSTEDGRIELTES